MNKDLLRFRKVTKEDARSWFTLLNTVWRDAYSHIFPNEVFIEREKMIDEKIKQFDEDKLNNNENIAYVAEYNGIIVGVMTGSINSSYDYFHLDYADLVVLYIDPKFQGLGIGTTFKEIFEKWAKENGAKRYVIGVLKENKKAREVYESWGGKLSNHEQGFKKLGVSYPEVFYTFGLD